jgi:tRNA 2-thiouridine synthesizing protein E
VPRNEAPPTLEALIDQDIDNIDAFLVYADWLQQQGDPRGEFILLCHEADRLRDNPAIAAARDQTIEDLGGQLLGDLHGPWSRGEVALSWRLGFVDRLRIKPGPDAQAILDGLPTQPCCRYLRSLDLSDTDIATLPDGLDTLAWIQELDLAACTLEEAQTLPQMARLNRVRVSAMPSSLARDRLSWKHKAPNDWNSKTSVLIGPLWLLAACYQAEAGNLSDDDLHNILDDIEFDEERYLVNLCDWSPAVCAALAKIDDGLELSYRHWMVIAFLRVYYDEYQIAPAVRVLTKAIGKALGEEWGTSRHLYELFIYGPAKQANRYTGLPKATGCI